MRVRDHVAVSTTAALLCRPARATMALGLWAGGVLIDADHYLWYCVRHRSLNPIAAVRYFNDGKAPRSSTTKALHHPLALIVLLIAAVRRPRMMPVLVGMGIHVGLDTFHEARMNAARRSAVTRDQFSCRRCGNRSQDVSAHVAHQPILFPSYRTENLISLCGNCHRLAHQRGGSS